MHLSLFIFIFLFLNQAFSFELIIQLKKSATWDHFEKLKETLSPHVVEHIENNLELPFLFKFQTTPAEVLKKLQSLDYINHFQKNLIYRVQGNRFPNDPLFPEKMTPLQSSLVKVWNEKRDCQNIIVSIIDTGINPSHVDLVEALWNKEECWGLDRKKLYDCKIGFSLVEGQSIKDYHGHGTQVASTIGALGDNSQGSAGTCWKANLLVLKAFNHQGKGSTFGLLKALYLARMNEVNIINLSFGRHGEEDYFLNKEIEKCHRQGILLFAAAGNNTLDLDKNPFWPCSHEDVLCVSSIEEDFTPSPTSNYGQTAQLAAFGGNTLTAHIGEMEEVVDDFNKNWIIPDEVATSLKNCEGDPLPTLLYPRDICQNKSPVLKEAYVTKKLFGDFNQVSFRSLASIPSLLASNHFSCLGDCEKVLNLGKGNALWDFKIISLRLKKDAYKTFSGTSLASAFATGTAALIWSYNPEFKNKDVRKALLQGAQMFSELKSFIKGGVVLSPIKSFSFLRAPQRLDVSWE